VFFKLIKSLSSTCFVNLHQLASSSFTGLNHSKGFQLGVEEVFIHFGVVGEACPVVSQ
jgi:hypothetical protein